MLRPAPLLLFALLLILLGFYAFLVLSPRPERTAGGGGQERRTTPSPVSIIDPVRGDPKGTVTIIEYGDFACDACRAAEPAVRELLAAAPGVRFVWRDFPIDTASLAAKRAALAARCAQDQGKFWEYHDLLLARIDQPFDPVLRDLAETVHLDEQAFAACLENDERAPVVERFQEEAIALGAAGAPTFFINGVRYDGPLTAAALGRAVAEAR